MWWPVNWSPAEEGTFTPTILSLFTNFLLVGLFGFGGGFGMVPLMKDLALGHHWLSISGFDEAIALGQITPGPVAVSATFIGERVAGLPGAVAATAGVFLPSLLVVVLLSHVYRHLRRVPGVDNVLYATLAGVVGLIAAVTISLGTGVIHSPGELIGALAAAFAAARLRLPYWSVIVSAALLGALFLRP